MLYSEKICKSLHLIVEINKKCDIITHEVLKMSYDKETIVKNIVSQIKDEINNDISADYKINDNQLYFAIDKYLYVPPSKIPETQISFVILDDIKDEVVEYSPSYIFFNLKDCLADFFSLNVDIITLFDKNTQAFVKWLIIGKILCVICNAAKKSWGKTEALILHKLHSIDRKNFVQKKIIFNDILQENTDINCDELESALQNLSYFNCIVYKDNYIKLNKYIIVRGQEI